MLLKLQNNQEYMLSKLQITKSTCIYKLTTKSELSEVELNYQKLNNLSNNLFRFRFVAPLNAVLARKNVIIILITKCVITYDDLISGMPEKTEIRLV